VDNAEGGRYELASATLEHDAEGVNVLKSSAWALVA